MEELKFGSYFYFLQPLETSAADILSMLKDRANGGRARFHTLITF